MLELQDPFDVVVRGHGDCVALVLIPGSIHANPQVLVRQYKTGKLFVADLLDCRAYGNPGDARDGLHIPEGW